mmetsp:Transcript_20132/g.58213  ORF Transcript_20132/g.58213 Transcript_20132/m.58213 type:complete len:242 (+) Transcript_20132:1533-2258(+)
MARSGAGGVRDRGLLLLLHSRRLGLGGRRKGSESRVPPSRILPPSLEPARPRGRSRRPGTAPRQPPSRGAHRSGRGSGPSRRRGLLVSHGHGRHVRERPSGCAPPRHALLRRSERQRPARRRPRRRARGRSEGLWRVRRGSEARGINGRSELFGPGPETRALGSARGRSAEGGGSTSHCHRGRIGALGPRTVSSTAYAAPWTGHLGYMDSICPHGNSHLVATPPMQTNRERCVKVGIWVDV